MYSINCRGRLFVFDKAKIMGVINTTPDSFYSASRAQDKTSILKQAAQMLNQGADILDIGGYSTRPGAASVSTQEEIDRTSPAIAWIKAEHPECFISIDTFNASVARAAFSAGADIVNDISGAQFDPELIETVSVLGMPYILSHIQGNIETMHQSFDYEDISADIAKYFSFKLAEIHNKGITDIIIDPGLGFSKSLEDNIKILKEIGSLHFLNHPIMLGFSRKSMLYKPLGLTSNDVLPASLSCVFWALQQGVQLLRVHDIAETKQVMDIFYTFQFNRAL